MLEAGKVPGPCRGGANAGGVGETQVRSLGQEDHLEESMGKPLQYSCLENPMDRGALWATVHRVAKSCT